MKLLHGIAVQPARLWRFLGVFQPPFLRALHASVAALVILQLISSAFMQPVSAGASASGWYHMWGGATLCLLAIVQTVYSLGARGPRYFFPYLWGDLEQLKKDVRQSLRFKMVAPRPKGLGAVIQGLGLGALALTAFSGLVWFWLWQSGSSYAGDARWLHVAVSILIILYLIGHGTMALIHFIVWEGHARQID